MTRIEQIKLDGESLPPPDRWSVVTRSIEKFSLSNYIRSLFFSTPGYFRIIVFTVTNVPFTSSGKNISRTDAIGWLDSGFNVLPEEIKRMNFTTTYECTALIYEFVKPESGDAYLRNPGSLTAADHLKKSKIIDALKK